MPGRLLEPALTVDPCAQQELAGDLRPQRHDRHAAVRHAGAQHADMDHLRVVALAQRMPQRVMQRCGHRASMQARCRAGEVSREQRYRLAGEDEKNAAGDQKSLHRKAARQQEQEPYQSVVVQDVAEPEEEQVKEPDDEKKRQAPRIDTAGIGTTSQDTLGEQREADAEQDAEQTLGLPRDQPLAEEGHDAIERRRRKRSCRRRRHEGACGLEQVHPGDAEQRETADHVDVVDPVGPVDRRRGDGDDVPQLGRHSQGCTPS